MTPQDRAIHGIVVTVVVAAAAVVSQPWGWGILAASGALLVAAMLAPPGPRRHLLPVTGFMMLVSVVTWLRVWLH